VLLVDFLAYCYHRLSHTSPLLWKFHAVHHSSSSMDWLAAARSHPLDQIFSRAFFFVPFYALGFNEKTFGIFLIIFALNGVFLHSNVRFRFKYLRWLIVTPEYHHWHHSNDPRVYDRNFAPHLVIFDLLFGTARLPSSDAMPSSYGVADEVPEGFLSQLIHPFRRQHGKASGGR